MQSMASKFQRRSMSSRSSLWRYSSAAVLGPWSLLRGTNFSLGSLMSVLFLFGVYDKGSRQEQVLASAPAPVIPDWRWKSEGTHTNYAAMNRVLPSRFTRRSGLLPDLRMALWKSETFFTD